MKIRNLLVIIITALLLSACGPYRGFKGVNDKGMKNNEMPSERVRKDYKKSEKKMQRQYNREMRKRAKRLGTTKKR